MRDTEDKEHHYPPLKGSGAVHCCLANTERSRGLREIIQRSVLLRLHAIPMPSSI